MENDGNRQGLTDYSSSLTYVISKGLLIGKIFE